MEVTISNFDEVLETLPDVVKDAQFITLDTEYTGLKTGDDQYNYYDTLEDWYNTCRRRATTFMAVQYGICAFQYDSELNKYTYRAYNFYVFPSSSSSKNFSCQVSSLKFLAKHGFDFNKLINDGIPYLTPAEVEEQLSKLTRREEKLASQASLTPTPNSLPSTPKARKDSELLDSAMQRLDQLLAGDQQEKTLPRYNSFIRRLIYQKCREKYGDDVALETNEDETLTVLQGLSPDDRKRRADERARGLRARVQAQVGFAKVIQIISQSGKPLVGHNVLIDLLFTVQQFVGPLPALGPFRELCGHLFPCVFDTKHLAGASGLAHVTESTLQGILDHVDRAGPEAAAPPGLGFTEGARRQHEAAYDAYLTGLAFIALVANLGKLNMTNVFKTLDTNCLLDDLRNRLSVPRLHDVPCLPLTGPLATPDRRGVFHVAFPEEWGKDDVIAHFKDFGYVNVSWIDSTSAYVGVKKDVVKKIKKTMLNQQGDCRVQTFHAFRSQKGASVEHTSIPEKGAPQEKGHATPCKRASCEDLGQVVSSLEKAPQEKGPTPCKRASFEDLGQVVSPPKKALGFEVPQEW